LDDIFVCRLGQARIRNVREANQVFIQPFAIRLLRGNLLFELFIGHDPPLFCIDEEHAARLEPALLQNSLGGISSTPTSLAIMTMSSLVT